MDVEIGEMTSTVRVTDSQSLINPQVLERIVRLVLERLNEANAHSERVQDEREMRPGVSARRTDSWS